MIAAMMKLGSLPPAQDPDHPTPMERAALRAAALRTKVAQYQDIFDSP
ncbi:MAG TPA: hypothetical protein VFN46_06290 [Acetobacteraceae bacterium]|nr:hypothetical protein [Acetobacteraceae bacterium]